PPLTRVLAPHQLDLVTPPAPHAHPIDDGTALLLARSVAQTAARLGEDGRAYRRLVEPIAKHTSELLSMVMRPPRPPRHPWLLARFGLPGLLSGRALAGFSLRGRGARALLAGAAAHSLLALDEAGTGAMGLLILASAHVCGWPV